MSFTTQRRKTNFRAPARQNFRQDKFDNQRKHFQFLEMKDEGGKIGTIIRSLHTIRQKAGGGAFINYKREHETEAGAFGEWIASQSKILPVRTQGPGWYIWAYNKGAMERAVALLKEAEQGYEKQQEKYRKQRERERRLENQEPEKQKVPTAADFPALGATSAAVGATPTPTPTSAPESVLPETSAWAQGKPQEKPEEKPQHREVPLMAIPVLKKTLVETLVVQRKEWDAWNDNVPKRYLEEEDDIKHDKYYDDYDY